MRIPASIRRAILAARAPTAAVWGMLAGIVVAGCASMEPAIKQQWADLGHRNVLSVAAGSPIPLASVRFDALVGLIDSRGQAQLAGIDAQRRVRHIQVDAEGKSGSEVVATLPEKKGDDSVSALDIVEHPLGTIRIAAGDTEFARPVTGGPWTRFEGNRCKRYLVHDSKLYCAFVIGGEEARTPPRTDVYGALVFIVPFAWSSTARPDKLALAERVESAWVTRAIVDSSDSWTAESRRPFIGVDRQGMLHMVFAARQGGGWLAIGPGVVGSGPERTLRYVRAPLPTSDATTGIRSEWQAWRSEGVAPDLVWTVSPTGEVGPGWVHCPGTPGSSCLRANAEAWAVAPVAGKAWVLLHVPELDGWAALPRDGGKALWLAVPDFPLGATTYIAAGFAADADDTIHFLAGTRYGLLGRDGPFVYVRRAPDGRIGAVVMPTGSPATWPTLLATGSGGAVFAAWTLITDNPLFGERSTQLVGRWIRSGTGNRPGSEP